MFLEHGSKYRGNVNLPGWVERHASNAQIEEQFCTAGFVSVHVQGESTLRVGEGIWGLPSQEVSDLDPHISNIEKIG